jgi:RNA polymerase sigma factor (sigma-70 family)
VPTSPLHKLVPELRQALRQGEAAACSDGQLLEEFAIGGDGAALEALVRRHGPMVWGVCRRVLGHHHDAEDAFQATFLVLVRKAASVVPRELVANWLYGVAHRTALRARAMAAKRRERERQVAEMPEPVADGPGVGNELEAVLDQELSRLPDHYRVAVVLCDLEGKTRREVAAQLSLPEGTVASRLARARAMLAKRLARRGVTLTSGALAGVLAREAAAGVPMALLASTLKVIGPGAIPATVAALTEGVLKAMLLNKLKAATAGLLVLGLALTGGGLLTQHLTGAPQGRGAAATTSAGLVPQEPESDKQAVQVQNQPPKLEGVELRPPAVPLRYQARELYEAAQNAAYADEHLTGKRVQVKGTVVRVTKEQVRERVDYHVLLVAAGFVEEIKCRFLVKDRAEVAKLSLRQTVIIEGICRVESGGRANTVSLTDCQVVREPIIEKKAPEPQKKD